MSEDQLRYGKQNTEPQLVRGVTSKKEAMFPMLTHMLYDELILGHKMIEELRNSLARFKKGGFPFPDHPEGEAKDGPDSMSVENDLEKLISVARWNNTYLTESIDYLKTVIQ